MKATNIRIVKFFNCPEVGEREMANNYSHSISCMDSDYQSNWYDWPKYINMYRRRYYNGKLPSFTASIVSYDYGDSSRGLTRRESLRILRKVGLRAPLAMEVFQVAAIEISTLKLVGTIEKNDRRRIMCPVPINPEFPSFYSFGSTRRVGYFEHCVYATIDDKDPAHSEDIYSYQHQNGEMSAGPAWHFPMLLGI